MRSPQPVEAADVKLQPFPSGDRAFVEYAHEALTGLAAGARNAAALQRAMRRRYPAAIVTPQDDLARHGSGPVVWYVYRYGSWARAAVGSTEAILSSPAWAILDDERRFVEMSAEFAKIAELPAAQMLGHRIEEFANPNDPTVRDDLAGLWEAFQRTGELASTIRFDYADGREREVAYRIVMNDPAPGLHRLTVGEIEPGD